MAFNIRNDPGYEGHRIVPSIPDSPADTYEDTDYIEERAASNGDQATIPELGANDPEQEDESQIEQVDDSRHIITRTLPPVSSLIAPSENAEQLYARMSDSESELSGDNDDPAREAEQSRLAEYNDDIWAEDAYRPGFHLQAADASARTSDSVFHASPGDFHQTVVQAGDEVNARDAHIPQEGQTSVSAILIQDSPTPPLRPLASSQARLAASANGRCGVGSHESDRPPLDNEMKTSLGELVCPICLGPPTPLVVTGCGHTL